MDFEQVALEDEIVHGLFVPYGRQRQYGLNLSVGSTLCSIDGVATESLKDMNCPVCWRVVEEVVDKLGRERSRVLGQLDNAQPFRGRW